MTDKITELNPENIRNVLIELFDCMRHEVEESIQREVDDITADGIAEIPAPGTRIRSAKCFDEAGLMTSDEGVVLRLMDGTEFQLTIKRSR